MSLTTAVESAPFPFEAAAEKRARAALAEAIRQHEQMQAELHAAIGECVRTLRSCGMPPEAMLVTMKAFVRDVTTKPSRRHSGPVAKPVMEQVVEMCIAEYFRDLESGRFASK